MDFHVLTSTHYREMGSIARTLHTRNDSRFAGLGLQKGQFVYLTRLCENPGVGVVRLARLARVDQTTATKAVQKLETAGYVTRQPDPEDGRSQLLVPTEKAREAWSDIVAVENADLEEGLAGFTPAESRQFLDFLTRVRTNLDGEAR
jgi:DNA-binding MarR family transcriptional regulator